nr:MAG TPA: hypothetical protein [Caudoviricetes sp.]
MIGYDTNYLTKKSLIILFFGGERNEKDRNIKIVSFNYHNSNNLYCWFFYLLDD